jgi:hypothetical protein
MEFNSSGKIHNWRLLCVASEGAWECRGILNQLYVLTVGELLQQM